MTVEWNYLDLFSGIGGFAKGIEEAGVKINNHFFSEISPAPIQVYKEHFQHAKGVGDVAAIRDVSQFGKIDITTFGFPCQDLSVAGKRKGLAGNRSGLFFEAMRLVNSLRPTYFIFENVKGIFTSDRGADFIRCLREIANLGCYDCEWQLVNTSWILPQNRERIYFIGHLRGKSSPKVFPFTEDDFAAAFIQGQKDITDNIALEVQEKTKGNYQGGRVGTVYGNSVTLASNGGGQGANTGLYVIPVLTPGRTEKRQNGRRFKENGDPSFTLTTQDQHGVMLIHEATKKGFVELQPNQGIDLSHPNSKTRRGRLMDKNCNTLMASTSQYAWYDGVSIRKLTPLEYERLQGFPDGWTAGKKKSDNSRYKMLGNAVSVPIVKMIIERLVA